MSEARVLHKLLTSGEYDELEDVVIVEGQFVEVDEAGIASRQVILGLTPELLLMAGYLITNYKDDPRVYYVTDFDPLLDGLEVSWVLPLCMMELTASTRNYGLVIAYNGRKRYFEMSNTAMNGDIDELWYEWLDRVDYLHEDPYRYIRKTLDRYDLPYPSYLREIEDQEQSKIDKATKTALEVENSRSNKVKNKRKGSKYIAAIEVRMEDVFDKEEENESTGKKLKKKTANKFCCISSENDGDEND